MGYWCGNQAPNPLPTPPRGTGVRSPLLTLAEAAGGCVCLGVSKAFASCRSSLPCSRLERGLA